MLRKFSVLFLVFALAFPMVTKAEIKTFNEPPFDFYKVSKGDSFWFIAQRYGLDYRELMRLNPDVEPLNMQIGSVIRLRDTASSPSSFEEQVAQLVNQERSKNGLSPLQHRADIKNVAEKKAMDLINSNYFSHNSPNYGSPFDMLRTFGISYRTAGENIAKGQKTPEEVMNAWMNSSGHRANILKPEFDSIGVGYYQGAWVQMFIGN
ncbi:LysM peptidoglycan-binding domain-containing protein [Ornithinibacillus sp. L9]|uniref:LysM peptidoglycan-binding domain-containing protein n=1 Tax=Ornithinibacillus caprae TaxID=2678566 RepID=A0A6N8FP77_9BACI|nr:CAP domain-containing protein [Ornithinibacillus caprae]MUK90716.1 LysM peptidoglycan-binding domain-containing protein [Ornithinibacillus caprae]